MDAHWDCSNWGLVALKVRYGGTRAICWCITADGAVAASGELLLAPGSGVWCGFGVPMMIQIWVQLADFVTALTDSGAPSMHCNVAPVSVTDVF